MRHIEKLQMDITYTEEEHDRDTFSAVTGHAFDINDSDIEKIIRRVLKNKFS